MLVCEQGERRIKSLLLSLQQKRTNSGVPTPKTPPSEPRNIFNDDDDDDLDCCAA